MLAVQFASFVAELTKTVICFEFVDKTGLEKNLVSEI